MSRPNTTGGDQALMMDAASVEQLTTGAWDALKGMFAPSVQKQVDAVMAAGGLSIHDLIAVMLGEILDLRSQGKPNRSLIASYERQLARILRDMGENQTLGNRPVRVPEGLRLVADGGKLLLDRAAGDEGDSLT